MQRAALAGAAVLLMAALCAAQVVPSSRADFGMACGIQDTSVESASGFVRSADGEWSAFRAMSGPGATDTIVARVWHETNWMVDMHDALGQGMATMHTGQMCFDTQGRITHMIDRYMEMTDCGCMRFTSLFFAGDGRVTRREQRFVSVTTGSEIEAPEVSKGFPEAWYFRRLEQLPFYSLVNK
jgi:hypothetical protein